MKSRSSPFLILPLSIFVLLGGLASAIAQGENVSVDETLQQKTELARQMHQFRPVQDQVNGAVDAVARMQPPADREAFRVAMRRVLNYKAIERVSIDAMVDTYTLEELEAMVEYYSKPEARSASEKFDTYAGKVQPEIVRMIDAAIMRVKTGGAP